MENKFKMTVYHQLDLVFEAQDMAIDNLLAHLSDFTKVIEEDLMSKMKICPLFVSIYDNTGYIVKQFEVNDIFDGGI